MSRQESKKQEYLELSEESKIEQLKHAETLKLYEMKQRARTVVVPTAVDDVKTKLRELGHPATLFGEDHADRRDRLKEVIASLQLNQEESTKLSVRALGSFLLSLFIFSVLGFSQCTFHYYYIRRASCSYQSQCSERNSLHSSFR
jgi:hypothetical protein